MKLFVVACICLSAYLCFPLPQRKSLEVKSFDVETKIKTEPKVASSTEILKALEILRLGIGSGMTISDAFQFAQMHSPRAASLELDQGWNQFRLGFPLSHGLANMAAANPGWQAISDTLTTSLQAGSPIADQLADVEFVLQSAIDTEKLKRIKSVAVKSVLPLGLCFLPAFILLAVVPIIAGLISGITQ